MGGLMASSSLFLGCVPDYFFDETDGKYTDTAFVLYRDKNGTMKLRTAAACEYLTASFACDIPTPFFDAPPQSEPAKGNEFTTPESVECNYLISTKYADTHIDQVLCDSFGYRWIIYPSMYTQISEATAL